MSPFCFPKAVSILTLIGASLACQIAAKAEDIIPTSIVRTPAAPIELTKCSTDSGSHVVANVRNRSTSFLISYQVRWTPYNHGGDRIGSLDQDVQPQQALAPGDEVTGPLEYLYSRLTEPVSALGRVTCRLQVAKFEGGKVWTYGHRWTGKLLKPSN